MKNMGKKIEDLEGIGPVYGRKLREQGIGSIAALLDAGATRKGRAELAVRTGLGDGLILRAVNMADLFRIRGVARQYAELLEAAGVDTVKELATRRADNLAARMREVNAARRLCRIAPGEGTVARWVAQAKTLTPIVTY
jgi:predicted flap endonuclease-1-like 5' DNA nuclease